MLLDSPWQIYTVVKRSIFCTWSGIEGDREARGASKHTKLLLFWCLKRRDVKVGIITRVSRTDWWRRIPIVPFRKKERHRRTGRNDCREVVQ